MNILILNWRDLGNPLAGGAERITEKYAKYWVEKKHSVYWLTNSYSGAKSVEEIDGVFYKRVGPTLVKRNKLALLFLYPIYLLHSIFTAILLTHKYKIDCVVDEIHGMPFFSPLYFYKRRVMLVCEVAGEIWDKMYPFPISFFGKVFERIIYTIFYKDTELWAISRNTMFDILAIHPHARIVVLPLGIEEKKVSAVLKKKFNHKAIFLARIVEMKGVEIAIQSVVGIVQKYPKFCLYIVGAGTVEYVSSLKKFIKQLGIEKNVIFKGFVSEEEKYSLFKESDFLFHTSYKEGFGLTVLEAAVEGTPSIIKAGSSLEELITEGKDGYIITNADELVERYLKAVDKNNIALLSKHAIEKVQKYFWPAVLRKSDSITKL